LLVPKICYWSVMPVSHDVGLSCIQWRQANVGYTASRCCLKHSRIAGRRSMSTLQRASMLYCWDARHEEPEEFV